MISNLDSVFIIFALFNNYLATSAKRLGGNTINAHRNYGGFCIGSQSAHEKPKTENRTEITGTGPELTEPNGSGSKFGFRILGTELTTVLSVPPPVNRINP
jgi:hypothetical protein